MYQGSQKAWRCGTAPVRRYKRNDSFSGVLQSTILLLYFFLTHQSSSHLTGREYRFSSPFGDGEARSYLWTLSVRGQGRRTPQCSAKGCRGLFSWTSLPVWPITELHQWFVGISPRCVASGVPTPPRSILLAGKVSAGDALGAAWGRMAIVAGAMRGTWRDACDGLASGQCRISQPFALTRAFDP